MLARSTAAISTSRAPFLRRPLHECPAPWLAETTAVAYGNPALRMGSPRPTTGERELFGLATSRHTFDSRVRFPRVGRPRMARKTSTRLVWTDAQAQPAR